MPITSRFNAELGIVETIYAGRIAPAELESSVTETLDLSRAHQTRLLLGDCTDLEGGHSVADLYHLASLVVATGPLPLKEAVILPHLTAPARDVEFWESTCQNRGLEVKVFPDRTAALVWLRS